VLSGGTGALLLAAVALVLWPVAGRRAVDRVGVLRRASPTRAAPRPATGDGGPATGRRWVLPGLAGASTALLVGGVPGLVAGAAVVAGVDRWLAGRAAGDGGRGHGEIVADLPGACDLLAVCLAAGVPVSRALAAVGGAVPAPLGPQLRAVAHLYRLGADPRRAWADAPEPLGAVGRLLVRAGESGASVSAGLRSLAADHRAEGRTATEAAVRRAGVWILAPLGLCFLPAFVCLGVVPMVLGIAADVLG
jgi:Flp pilus assembly protein TadB